MAQQINLCTPILLAPKRYFSANTMAITFGVFLALGSALCATWVWNLNQTAQAFRGSVAAQAKQLDGLKAAIAQSKAQAAAPDAALAAQLQGLRLLATQRSQLREALQQGLFEPGWGHSDRLALLARTIPTQAWVTDVKMDNARLEVSGYTLETSALNDWVDRLALAPLTQGLKLSTVKVESAPMPAALRPASAASASRGNAERAVWSFHLVSTAPARSASPAASTPRSAP